jgi:hypothetical protein
MAAERAPLSAEPHGEARGTDMVARASLHVLLGQFVAARNGTMWLAFGEPNPVAASQPGLAE